MSQPRITRVQDLEALAPMRPFGARRPPDDHRPIAKLGLALIVLIAAAAVTARYFATSPPKFAEAPMTRAVTAATNGERAR